MKYVQIDDASVDDPAAGFDLRESEKDESKADDVLGIALRRAEILGNLYPFKVFPSQKIEFISAKKPSLYNSRHEAYLFHLLFSGLEPDHISPEARHLFEVESKSVLHDHFGGEAFHFGWTKLNASKGKAANRVKEFCDTAGKYWKPHANIKERAGGGNDFGIDAIVWKQVDDTRENALIIIGQCASGRDWETKLETNAGRLLGYCFESEPSGPVVNCFCTAFHIPEDKWQHCARRHNGILFDRLRMVLESQPHANVGKLYNKDSRSWLVSRLKDLYKAASR